MTDDDSSTGFELTRRRILGGIGTIGAASAAAGAGTMAYFSDTESSTGNTISAGTLDLEIGSSGELPIGVSDKAPGWSNTYTADLTNSGTIEGGLHVEVTNVSVSDGDGTGDDSPESEESYALSNGLKDELWIEVKVGGTTVIPKGSIGTAEMQGKTDALERLSGTKDLDVSVGIDADATNEIQGDQISFDVKVYLEQQKTIKSGNYSSIQAAINAASPGDTVEVASGTHTESGITINTDNIQVTGAGVGQTIVDGGGDDRVFVVEADGVMVSGFTVQNAHTRALEVSGVQGGPRRSGVTVSEFEARNIKETGTNNGRAVVANYSDDILFRDINSHDNGNDGVTFWYVNDSRMENITANNNDDNGIYFNGDNNALLHSDADGNHDEGVDINWYEDINSDQQRVLLDGITAQNNKEEDIELHDNGTDNPADNNSKLLKNIDTTNSTAPVSLHLGHIHESELEEVNTAFPNGRTTNGGTDADPSS